MKTGNPLILIGFIAGFVLAFGGYKYWRASQGWERAYEIAERPIFNPGTEDVECRVCNTSYVRNKLLCPTCKTGLDGIVGGSMTQIEVQRARDDRKTKLVDDKILEITEQSKK